MHLEPKNESSENERYSVFKEFSSSEVNLASPEFREHLSELNYGSVKETSFPK